LGRLVSVFHKIIGELIKTFFQRLPGRVFWNENNDVPYFFDEHIMAGKAEFLGQPYGLTSTVNKNFSCLH
jgi:hypothetical protein